MANATSPPPARQGTLALAIASHSARISNLRVRSGYELLTKEAFQCSSSSSKSGRRRASHHVLCGCCLKYWRTGNIPPLFRRRIGPSPPSSPSVRWRGVLWIARHPAWEPSMSRRLIRCLISFRLSTSVFVVEKVRRPIFP